MYAKWSRKSENIFELSEFAILQILVDNKKEDFYSWYRLNLHSRDIEANLSHCAIDFNKALEFFNANEQELQKRGFLREFLNEIYYECLKGNTIIICNIRLGIIQFFERTAMETENMLCQEVIKTDKVNINNDLKFQKKSKEKTSSFSESHKKSKEIFVCENENEDQLLNQNLNNFEKMSGFENKTKEFKMEIEYPQKTEIHKEKDLSLQSIHEFEIPIIPQKKKKKEKESLNEFTQNMLQPSFTQPQDLSLK